MDFETAVSIRPVLLAEGAVIERIHRLPEPVLDPLLLNTPLIYDPKGKAVMGGIYRGYADIGRVFGLPMILLTPTWRANPVRLARSGFDDARRVNTDCVHFVSDIRDGYGGAAADLFVGGLIGCVGDAYRPEEALGTNEAAVFHREQIDALAGAGVDFLLASTLPAVSEAMGIARAMGHCGLPYVLGFVVRGEARLLDGTPLARAMTMIDEGVQRAPLFYMINCVHPKVVGEVFSKAERQGQTIRGRMIGLQANTSSKSPEELDELDELDTEEPNAFADSMLQVHHRLGIKILGGCCGTDDRHIRCIAERVSAVRP